jgi:hypothetical protein
MVIGGAKVQTLPKDLQTSQELLKLHGNIMKNGQDYARKNFKSEIIDKYLAETGRKGMSPVDLWKEMVDSGTLSGVGKVTEEGAKLAGQIGEWSMIPEQYRRVAQHLNFYRQTKNVNEAHQAVRETLFNYAELSKTEREVFKRLMPFYCVPESSLALTRIGWKKYTDIKIGEDLLTYSMEKDEYEWKPALEISVFDHDEELISLSNTRHEILFTPEHRWVVEKHKQNIKKSLKEYSYPKEVKITTGKELNTLNSIKVVSEYKGTESIISVEDARLLGWLLTDGYFRKRKNYIEAVIYQHPNKFLDEVKDVAGGRPRKPHPVSGTICVPVLKERVKRIGHLLDRSKKADDWCDVVGQMSREAMEVMYDAMYKADGTVSEGRSQDSFACESKDGVARTFEMLATLLGYRVAKNKRGYYVSKHRNLRIAAMKKEMKHYTGKVWCPRTENGTWVMKQGNLITITGNSFSKNNLIFQFKNMIHEPQRYSKFVNLLDSLQNAMIGPDQENWDLLPEWLRDDRYSLPLGTKDGTMKTLSNINMSFEDLENLDMKGTISKLNPLLKMGIELSTGQSTFMRQPIEEMRGGHRYEYHPLKKLLGYQERDRGGRTQQTVDPYRRYFAENIPYVSTANLLAQRLGRIGGPLMDKDKPSSEALTGLSELTMPVRTFEHDIESQRRYKEVEDLDELYKLLYRKGMSDKFTRFYIPADIREQLLRELR